VAVRTNAVIESRPLAVTAAPASEGSSDLSLKRFTASDILLHELPPATLGSYVRPGSGARVLASRMTANCG